MSRSRSLALLFLMICAFIAGSIVGPSIPAWIRPAHAGITEDNIQIGVHYNPGDTESTYDGRIHHGNDSVDIAVPEFNTADFFALKAAAMDSQASFDAEATRVFGATWYGQTGLTTARKANFRQGYIRVCQ